MKLNVAKIVKDAQEAVSRHSPEILMGIGIAGMITTTILAVKATPKAMRMIEDKKCNERKDKLTPVETVKTAWKPYVPAATTGVFSIACLVGSGSVNAKRNAALATAYKLSETALTEYREKVIETIGEKKEKIVQDKVDQARLEKNPVTKTDVIITGKGTSICYDSLAGRYFESDIDTIKRAVNELNRRMLLEMYVSLNDFYDELDLDHSEVGDELGWKLDDGLVEVDFGSQLTDDNRPCVVLRYRVAPKRDYYKFV